MLWSGVFPPSGVFDQILKRHRLDLCGLLYQTIEKFAARPRGTAVKPKSEFIEVVVQMFMADPSLMGGP